MDKDTLIIALVALLCLLVIVLCAWETAHFQLVTTCLENYWPSRCKEFF